MAGEATDIKGQHSGQASGSEATASMTNVELDDFVEPDPVEYTPVSGKEKITWENYQITPLDSVPTGGSYLGTDARGWEHYATGRYDAIIVIEPDDSDRVANGGSEHITDGGMAGLQISIPDGGLNPESDAGKLAQWAAHTVREHYCGNNGDLFWEELRLNRQTSKFYTGETATLRESDSSVVAN